MEGSAELDQKRLPRVSRRRALRVAAHAALGAVSIPWIVSCGSQRAPSTIVAYVSADDVLAREVLAACRKATGIDVEAAFDTEATKTMGLERRLLAERDRPRADLFWSSEGFAAVRLAKAGILRALPAAIVEAWPAVHRDPNGRWLAFAARARVVVSRAGADAPAPIEAWADLARPNLARGSAASIAIADPRFGTTNSHLAALRAAWRAARGRGVDALEFDAWLDGMRANGVRILPGGNAATVEAVATGECAYGLTDTDDALAAIERGLPLTMTLPRSLPAGTAGGGTMLVPNTVCAIAGGPGDASRADAVAAFLVSPACEEIIARSPSRNLPLGPKATARVPYAESDPLGFDLAEAAEGAAGGAIAAKARLEGAPS